MNLKDHIEKRMDAIATTAENFAAEINDMQQVRAFISRRVKDIALNERQQKIMERYQYVYSAKVSGKYNDTSIAEQLVKMYGISENQALRDMHNTQEIFGEVVNIHKKFELRIMLDMNARFTRKAEEAGDLKALAAFEKNRLAITKEIEEQDVVPGEHFEGHVLEAVFDPRLLGVEPTDMKEVLKVINEKRDKKLNESFIEDAIVLDGK